MSRGSKRKDPDQMRKAILIAVAVGAIVVGGTAFAYSGGPGPFGNNDERQAELASDLAAQLDGVNPNEVEQALDTVREENRAEHRQQMAEAIASQLDSVSADQVESALETVHEQIQAAGENGERPERGVFATTLADELGVSEEEIQSALQAAHQEKAEQRLNEAVEPGNLTQEEADQIRERIENGEGRGGRGGPGGPGFGPGGPPSGGPDASAEAQDAIAPTI